MDEEDETMSKALAPIADDVKAILQDISNRLEGSLEILVVSCGSVRDRFLKIHDQLPDELADVITPAAYLEQHRLKLEKAKQRIADCRERKELEATIQASRASINEEKAKLDELETGPNSTQTNIDRLNARKIELLADLEQCNAQIALEEQKLANLPKATEDQRSKLKASIKHLADLTKSLKVIPGTAISAIQRYVSG